MEIGFKQNSKANPFFFFFFVKVQGVNVLDFVGHMVSVMTTQLCHSDIKAVINSTRMNEGG